MTIDSTWLAAFKREAPAAFVPRAPFRYSGVFVDGQIKLMQGLPTAIGAQTWDEYIHRQFVRHLDRFLDVADTVVLAFDNYEHVPVAKCMTQTARRKNVPVEPFGDTSPLPCMVPHPTLWMQQIMNRKFKARVIELVIVRLPEMLLRRRPDKTLIVDYKDVFEYRMGEGGRVAGTELQMRPLGEADVKFTRYTERFSKMVVDSIDGDSIPIALVHHERCLSQGLCPPRVAVYRLEMRLKDDAETAKRKRVEGKKILRTFEFVDVTLLYEVLKEAIAQSVGRSRLPSHEGHEVRMLVSLIALTGTDFSRGLPGMSGASVFEMLPQVWLALCGAYDAGADQVRAEGSMRLLGCLYSAKYSRHVGIVCPYPEALAALKASKLADRTKDALPSLERIRTTVCNVNWVLQYWTCEPTPDPISEQFGYRLVRPGAAQYADLVPA